MYILRGPQKFEEISHFYLTFLLSKLKKRWIFFVAFSEYINFMKIVDSQSDLEILSEQTWIDLHFWLVLALST